MEVAVKTVNDKGVFFNFLGFTHRLQHIPHLYVVP